MRAVCANRKFEANYRLNGALIVPNPRSARPFLLALAGLATLSLGVATAHAEYGEVAGSPVVLTGKVSESPLVPHVLGVDPTDKSFYVGDEVEGAKEAHFYRIQKFSASGEALAEVQIKAKVASNSLSNLALEGVAVDPVEKRLYVLVNREREPEEGEPVFDPSPAIAAATLYAFSTEVKNAEHKLELVGKKGEGAFADLSPVSEVPGVPLLEPHGIAVDPTNHDIVILGQEDEQTELGHEPELRTAVQRIHASGSLGPRYVDVANCLDGGSVSGGEQACEVEGQPFSPIVVPGAKGSSEGKVYAERQKEVWEIPSSSKEIGSKGTIKRFETSPKRLLPTESNQELGSEQALIEFPKANEGVVEATGGTMSFVPEGGEGEGKIYLTAAITIAEKGSVTSSAGVLVIHYAEHAGTAEAKELGWTGGQAETTGEKCRIPKKGNEGLLISGGENEQIFVLDSHGSPVGVDIFEFGPGGGGCPHAGATVPSVKVKNSQGEEVEVSPVPLGEAATLSSTLSEGNAVNVKWTFDDLTTKEEEPVVEEGYEFQTTSLKHKFEHPGEYEVTEEIETDNLANPKVTVKQKVKVGAKAMSVEFNSLTTATVGQPMQFEAAVNDPNESGTHHLKYEWTFGDGEKSSGETTSTAFGQAHTYQGESPEEPVTLRVTDAHGVSGEVTHTISVVKEHKEEGPKETPKEAPKEAPKEGPKNEPPHVESPPEAALAGTSLNINSSGAVTLKVTCPSGDSSCSGTLTLRTLEAVAARTAGRHRKGKHKAILTLATGSFTVAGGQIQAVTLRLSPTARALLVRVHVLRAQVTLVAHNPAGATHTTQTTITLRAPVKAKRHRKH
jgi:hypothetical protein